MNSKDNDGISNRVEAGAAPPDATGTMNESRARTRTLIRLAGVALAIAVLVLFVRALPAAEWLQAAIAWTEQLGAAAPAAYVLVYFLATMLMLPAWPLSVAAGVLFGLLTGTLVVVAGAMAGAAGAFILTRHLARRHVEARLRKYPKFAAVDRAVAKGSWRVVLLLRLSPALPFTLQNFAYGLTAIRFWPCMFATAVGILPGVFMYVYFGFAGRVGIAAAGSGFDGGLAQNVLIGVGLVATFAATWYVTRLARREIARHGALTAAAQPADRD